MSKALSSNNKVIFQNTILLYIRMIFLLGISFYTTRVVLQILGVVDLGIYNVVGGVVSMMGFVNGSLSSASSRFITFVLGKDDIKDLQSTFNTIVSIHILVALIILLLSETLGLWFVYNKLIIPDNRMFAAICVFQSAVISSIFVIISSPFNADIIAHEKMSAFAYISIFEAVSKLLIVFLLDIVVWDKLITYAILLIIVQGIVILLYILYCRKHFIESKYLKFSWDENKIKKIFSYAGWVMTGSFAYICSTQGLNILLNLFFGPAVNASRAIAIQLQGALNNFTINFQTAVKPQITKSYAQEDFKRMHNLVLTSSRLGGFLMLMLIVPIFVNTEFLLSIWLKEIPDHTINFVRIIIFIGLISALKDPTLTAIHATGHIKKMEIVEMFFMFSILPLIYVLLKSFGLSPECVLLIYLISEILTQFARVWVVYPQVGMSQFLFYKKVFIPIIVIGVIVIIISLILKISIENNIINNLLLLFTSELLIILGVFIIGLDSKEKKLVREKFTYFINKKILNK